MTANPERKSTDEKDFDFIFAVNGLPLAGSGGARIVVALVNTLQNKGYKIGIISLPRKPWFQVLNKEVAIPRVQRILLKLNDSPLTYRFFNPLFRFIIKSPSHFKINRNVKIITVTKIKNYDCRIYIATNFINANQLKLIGIPLEKIILFSQIDETDSIYSGKYSGLALEIYKTFSKRLFINQDVVERFPGSKKIGMGIDLSLYRPSNPIDSRTPGNVVFITRNGEQKDPETAITAMNKIHVANPGANISAYGNLNKGDLPDFVDYHPSPSDKEVVALLNSNSIFVTTSVLEGYPLPPLEAMACGCAVISTDSVGVKEYLSNGVNGILCPIRNPDLIAESVLQLISEDRRRMEIARKGYETAMEHSYEDMTDNFLKIIAEFSK
jgi:glycosyltransferase involved in cell wall biosynthesis